MKGFLKVIIVNSIALEHAVAVRVNNPSNRPSNMLNRIYQDCFCKWKHKKGWKEHLKNRQYKTIRKCSAIRHFQATNGQRGS